eukprot:CAMPEP_0168403768 /NCGR_PEP_ID=MMETSP0228-20121227/24297_1 /TAXON_ID=133427 /ORGANISM="Protoceratium reticulatum, Strain CCCM 535 (=CCMP 1889)" /LENGTH=48 /DNA_ID= /DNA_START= /DNA_END= /DNA_ORIENTATION=
MFTASQTSVTNWSAFVETGRVMARWMQGGFWHVCKSQLNSCFKQSAMA